MPLSSRMGRSRGQDLGFKVQVPTHIASQLNRGVVDTVSRIQLRPFVDQAHAHVEETHRNGAVQRRPLHVGGHRVDR